MYNKKEAGRINLLNVFFKAKSIYVNSFLRSFLFSGENESLIKYYCALQLNPLFKIRNLPVNVSPLTTPYYSSVTATLRACSKLRNFPNITSKVIYEFILLKQPPKVEEKYSLFNWKTIWKNLAFKCIRSDDRCILFKYLHEILPNNSRLYEIKRKPSPNCDMCNLEENNLHMMYYCKNKEFTVKYLRGLLQKCLDVDNISLIKMLFLDTTGFHKRDSNTITAIVVTFICTIWYSREHRQDKINILKKNLILNQKHHKAILKDKMDKIFNDQYCQLNSTFLEKKITSQFLDDDF